MWIERKGKEKVQDTNRETGRVRSRKIPQDKRKNFLLIVIAMESTDGFKPVRACNEWE